MKIRLGGSLIVWQPLQSLSGEAASACASCVHSRSVCTSLLPLCLWQLRKCDLSAVVLLSMPMLIRLHITTSHQLQELIKSHSWKAFTIQQFWFLLHIARNKNSKSWAVWPHVAFFLQLTALSSALPKSSHLLFMASIHIANFCHLFHHTSSWSDPVPYWPAELGADKKHAVGAATELRRSMGRFSATSVLG